MGEKDKGEVLLARDEGRGGGGGLALVGERGGRQSSCRCLVLRSGYSPSVVKLFAIRVIHTFHSQQPVQG